MLRNLNTGEPVDLLPMLHAEPRDHPDRPWVMLNMVASVDGATAVRGGATALNDADDRALFLALRSVADVVLVGAETVRAENLGPVRMTEEMREHRPPGPDPRLAIASRSVNIGAEHRVFSDPERKPFLVVPEGADVGALRSKAEVLFMSSGDGAGLVEALGDYPVILCEGGPTLNSLLIASGLVDEINLTLSPLFALGESKRVASGPELDPPQDLRLTRTLIGDRSLFLRYVREPG